MKDNKLNISFKSGETYFLLHPASSRRAFHSQARALPHLPRQKFPQAFAEAQHQSVAVFWGYWVEYL